MSGPVVLIAGGGTGGHLFPGIAVAEELRARGCEVIFVGTARGIEVRACPREGWPLALIDVGGLRGGGVAGALKGLLRVPRSVWQSRKLLKTHAPKLVIGVGGYASGPVCLAAWMRGVPVVVLEQNSVPGFTNKLVGRFARRVFLTFDESRGFFPKKRAVVAGNPVRKRLVEANRGGAIERPARPFTLFVFGGSQGARGINNAMIAAAPGLAALGDTLRVVHQTGEAMAAEVQAAYQAAGVTAEVHAFIHDMAAEYRRAHLVVSRAGATTLAELALAGKAAILVPFPFATDDHQTKNAQSLVQAGAALLVPERELTTERLLADLGALMAEPTRLAQMEDRARTLARPDAAREIVDACFELAGLPSAREAA